MSASCIGFWVCAKVTQAITTSRENRSFIAVYRITGDATLHVVDQAVKRALKDATIPALAAIAVLAMLFVPPIHQDPAYHHFADQRTLFGIPNFFNVVSNLPFLFVAIWGWRAARTLAHR